MMTSIQTMVMAITFPIRYAYFGIVQITPGLKRLPSISPAMRMALMMLLFLLIIWIAAGVRQIFWPGDRANMPWSLWFFVALPLVVVIPVLIYYLVKFWMMKDVSRFPDIDAIWDQAVAACESKGIFLTQVPLFVVLGNPDLRRANQLARAAQMEFPVTVPEGGQPPVSVLANNEAAFVFVDGCSCLSGLSNASGNPSASAGQGAPPSSGGSPMATLDPFSAGESGKGSEAPPPAITGTLTDSAIIRAEPPRGPSSAGAGATLQLSDGENAAEVFGGGIGSGERRAIQLSSQEMYEREQRLRHVCRRIVRERNTLCPINGLLSIVPFELVETSSGQIQTAAQKDLAILREELQVRCPNTVLVTELEREEGFQELIKRVGTEKSRDFRFGKGCEIWCPPEESRMKAVAVHASAAFEDWTYMLFQEPDALKHRYNSRLFRLLCRIRGGFAANLQAVLSNGFGFNPTTEPHLAWSQFLFSGCYFGAAGGRPGQHAFVKSVFQKLIEQEGELEWAPAARQKEQQRQFLASMLALIGVVSLVATVIMIVIWWRANSPTGSDV